LRLWQKSNNIEINKLELTLIIWNFAAIVSVY
jgi:hypothetical protein